MPSQVIEYPKTKNLHKRDDRGRMLEDELQLPEAASVQWWQAHEKVDGTNCRLDWRYGQGGEDRDDLQFSWGGRTDRAQLHGNLEALLKHVVWDNGASIDSAMEAHGLKSITVFAEGIGPKIQGNLYGLTEHKLVAFDVLVNDEVFLPQDAVTEYAEALGIERAPMRFVDPGEFGLTSYFLSVTRTGFHSHLNPETVAEGLILRPRHELRTQAGERVQIKLKHRDYVRSN